METNFKFDIIVGMVEDDNFYGEYEGRVFFYIPKEKVYMSWTLLMLKLKQRQGGRGSLYH